MPRPETAVGAVVLDGDRLLLIQRGRGSAQGEWSVPGGRVEFGETLARAVEREVAEETGLAVRCGAYIGFVERIGPDHHYVIHDFHAELTGPAGPLRPDDDAADAAWVPMAELDTWPLVDGMLDFLRDHGIAAPAS